MAPTKDTRDRIVAAAAKALKERGFAGASSRAIATIGDFNPALIFYYFGSVHDLLAAVLEESSGARLLRYGPAAREVGSLSELFDLLARVYREDYESGHIRVVSELVAASVTHPELGERVVALMQPWVELAEETIARVADRSGLGELAPARELALASVTFYLGANLLTQLVDDPADVGRLIELGQRMAPLAELLGGER